MGKCNCWEERIRNKYTYNKFTGLCDGSYSETYGICNGTRERDECNCGGNESKCDFYEEVRMKSAITHVCKNCIGYNENKTYTIDEVAQILTKAFGDNCACNYNGNDEWLPYICEHQDTCPDTPEENACWKQYLKWVGQKDKILEKFE